ncbi:phosphoglucosamine mutase [Parasulfuritortus cantonensis]|uniref:Phosphoglucosamine mutase n=1 Tax=Parasulfuritortus cantonensis TaxID=2528202 RepID=A0A4R1BLQ1_9PROT|nr:phosphoglucosamine mutase [Parasulfuritortus cantonensis]TCJ18208.1 phosphoglucosamine mutase [Parasulfuritortus cantonensis]
MSRKYFGTDGVRGKVGETPITPDFVMRLGYAAGKVLVATGHASLGGERPCVLIGKDTRVSGYMLESALEAGFTAAGVDVRLTGPIPTPGIAYLTRALRLQAGVVISASHNPYDDNGIKFFSATGAKLPDDTELAIEAALDAPMQTVASRGLGKVKRLDDAAGRYIEFCKSTFPNDMDLRGLRVVVDCAHGAGYHIAPPVFHELGAEVIAVGNRPDGFNINEACGATHPEALARAVREQGADLGIALDGDGDRLIMADRSGEIADGDRLLYAIARHRLESGQLKGGVVGTLMTNLGTETALRALGCDFRRAKVGDRYVLEMLNEAGWQLGGETSGHILCLDRHTTGDGIISALQVLAALRRSGRSLADVIRDCPVFPQVLINVRVARGFTLEGQAGVPAAVAAVEAELGDNGRVVLRASGTEPLIRVMVEGRDADQVSRCAERIAAAVRAAAGV